MKKCNAPYKSKDGRCDSRGKYPDDRCGRHTKFDSIANSDGSDQPDYSNAHIGEKPAGWPKTRIAKLPAMWHADQIAEDIEQCRGCSNDNGHCPHHRGVVAGYDHAVNDMTRAFDITIGQYPDELLEDDG